MVCPSCHPHNENPSHVSHSPPPPFSSSPSHSPARQSSSRPRHVLSHATAAVNLTIAQDAAEEDAGQSRAAIEDVGEGEAGAHDSGGVGGGACTLPVCH
jgi:hypothetical protein